MIASTVRQVLGPLWVALLVACTVAMPVRAQPGAAVGLNFDSITDIDVGDREATFDQATGYHIGIFYDLEAGPIAIRPGLFYRQISDLKVDISGVDNALTPFSFDFSLIEVPVDVRARMVMPFVKPYLLIGPVFSFASTGDEAFEDALEDLTIAGNIGLGVEVNLPGFTPRLLPEIRYGFGISRFMKEDLEIAGYTFQPEDAQRLNTIMLRLGIVF